MDAPARRMIGGLLAFLVIGVAASLWRGDSPGQIAAYTLAGLGAGGLIIACYLWVRRND